MKHNRIRNVYLVEPNFQHKDTQNVQLMKIYRISPYQCVIYNVVYKLVT